MSRPVAFFDFDGTLTRRDSLFPFLRQVRGMARFTLDVLVVLPQLTAYTLQMMKNDVAKEALLRQTLRGYLLEELRSRGQRFAEMVLPRMLRQNVMEQFRVHLAHGHCCVLVSASLDLYLEPWAKAMGFEHCIASSLVVDSQGKVTGRLAGGNCYGQEKVNRIREFLSCNHSLAHTYAYGDSSGDAFMLGIVDEGYWVANEIRPFRSERPG